MIKAILFALLFAVIGLVAFAFIAPLFVHGDNARKLGVAAFPVIVVVGGGAGFVFGLSRRKR